MSAIDQLFGRLRAEGKKALMPFVTAGDPDLKFTARLLEELSRRGASLCEVGIPYSDPIADGPVIQASYTRALERRVRVTQIFDMLRVTAPTLQIPVVTMVSYAIVARHGLAEYVEAAQTAGTAGVIVPDLPVEEAADMAKVCRDRDFSLVQLVTPTTPRQRALRIAETSSGFLYYVSVTGITGERQDLPDSLIDEVSWLKEQTPLPVCIGFGISQPEHVRQLAPVADGLIVGSAVVRRVAQATEGSKDAVLADVGAFVAELTSALS